MFKFYRLISAFIFIFFVLILSACSSDPNPEPPAAPDSGPSISAFSASTDTITAGDSVQLSANFSNGSGVIDNGVGAVTSGVSVSASPTTTTTYVLTVSDNNGNSVIQSLTITVLAAPLISEFSANPLQIVQGQSASLLATFSGGSGVIDNSVGDVTSGTPVSVSPVTTTTYQLTVSNALGATMKQEVTVTVTPLTPGPSVTSFTASSNQIRVGDSVDLTAVFENGSGSIDNGVGAVSSGIVVSITPTATTTYTLTVSNNSGESATESLTVTVVAAPEITAFTASSVQIITGQSVDLTAVFINGTGEIDNGVGTVTSGNAVSVSPNATTTYTLTVTNILGDKVTQTLSVTVSPAPVLTSFTASATQILSGQSVELLAVFENASAEIDNGVGAVSSGVAVSVSPTQTTTYTLTVAGANASVITANVTITVLPEFAAALANTAAIVESVRSNVSPAILSGTFTGGDPCATTAFIDCLPVLITTFTAANDVSMSEVKLQLDDLVSIFSSQILSPGDTGSISTTFRGSSATIEYNIVDFTHFKLRGVIPSIPEFSAYIEVNASTITYIGSALSNTIPITAKATIAYTDQSNFDYEWQFSSVCDSVDVRGPERIVERLEKRGNVLNAKLMSYHPRWLFSDTAPMTCADAATDVSAMMFYYAFAAEDTLATAAVYLLPRTVATVAEIPNYAFSAFCTNFPYCVGDVGPWSPQPKSTNANKYCISNSGVAWGTNCNSTEPTVSSPNFDASPTWMAVTDLVNLLITVPANLN